MYSIHASILRGKRRIAIKRSATSATQLLFPLQIVIFKRRIAVSGVWNWKSRHSAQRHVYCISVFFWELECPSIPAEGHPHHLCHFVSSPVGIVQEETTPLIIGEGGRPSASQEECWLPGWLTAEA